MGLRIVLATLHLLALAIGFGAIFLRAEALDEARRHPTLKRVFWADNLWGLAAVLWIGTGLWRAFGSLEKGTEYYLGNSFFWLKMGAFTLIFALEILPMVTLMKWRIASRKGRQISIKKAHTLALISRIQLGLLVIMILLATGMTRGAGM